jgi:hypothetical protein
LRQQPTRSRTTWADPLPLTGLAPAIRPPAKVDSAERTNEINENILQHPSLRSPSRAADAPLCRGACSQARQGALLAPNWRDSLSSDESHLLCGLGEAVHCRCRGREPISTTKPFLCHRCRTKVASVPHFRLGPATEASSLEIRQHLCLNIDRELLQSAAI